MNPLKKKIGIIGGGQLGKMMIQEAKKMGFYVSVLNPVAECPCRSISDKLIVAGFNDSEAIRRLAETCDVITYEFEHIDAQVLLELEAEGRSIYPAPKSLINIQNKFTQKTILKNSGIAVGDFMALNCESDLLAAERDYGYPYFMKAATGGYDGKGNFLINCYKEALKIYKKFEAEGKPLMAERFVDFEKEISVLAARAPDGSIEVYPVAENLHINSILHETSVPAAISEANYENARALAKEAMRAFDGVGMFCVELFVQKNGGVLVNELAPRPHNSGHYTIEACYTSQFEQHIRAICGLPLGSPELLSSVVMRNIIGPPEFESPCCYEYSGIEEIMRIKGLSFHDYAKTKASKGRKLGHYTILAETVEAARHKADEAAASLSVKEVL